MLRVLFTPCHKCASLMTFCMEKIIFVVKIETHKINISTFAFALFIIFGSILIMDFKAQNHSPEVITENLERKKHRRS